MNKKHELFEILKDVKRGNKMAAEAYDEILLLFNVSQQRELLLDYEIYNASEDDKENNMKYLKNLVDTYLSNNCS